MTYTIADVGDTPGKDPKTNAQKQAIADEWNANDVAAAADEAANGYKRRRAAAYAPMAEQQDMQYWDAVNGTTTWMDHIAAVKAANAKSS
jgi:hypothetical protein